jgi:hypothetical protein
MTESESEAETLERLEGALRRIALVANRPRRPNGPEIDGVALARSLDLLIARLRAGLEPPGTSTHGPE